MVELVKLNAAPEEGGLELPRNVEAEAALLGALMIDNRIAEDVQLKLKPEHFFEPLHGRIYEAVMRLIERDMIANPVTLKPMLEQDPALKELGGAEMHTGVSGLGEYLAEDDREALGVARRIVGTLTPTLSRERERAQAT